MTFINFRHCLRQIWVFSSEGWRG